MRRGEVWEADFKVVEELVGVVGLLGGLEVYGRLADIRGRVRAKGRGTNCRAGVVVVVRRWRNMVGSIKSIFPLWYIVFSPLPPRFRALVADICGSPWKEGRGRSAA